MSLDDQRARYATVTAGSRVFALVALAPLVAISQDYHVIANALLLAAIWTSAVFAEGLGRVPVMPALVVESSLVAFVACIALQSSPLLLVALVIPMLIGGLVRGVRGALEVLGAEAAVCAAAVLPNGQVQKTPALAEELFVWLVLGLGMGLVGAFLHRSRSEDATTTSYRDARRLLVRLNDLSGELLDGLDPVTLSERLLVRVRHDLPVSGAVVYARTPHGFTPLVEGDLVDDGNDHAELLDRCFTTAEPVVDVPVVAFPLMTDAGVVAVVAGGVLPGDRSSTSQLTQQLQGLTDALRPLALQLDTALIFMSLRDGATAEERRRLARELHDGVAQDLASLGYLIDDLAETAASRQHAELCDQLRTELRRVVTELRRSLFVLRNEPGELSSLGQGVEALARHIETRSGLRVRVVLDEGTRRLRPDVEAELLRIAQEGMTNAVKHSRGHNVEVLVQVHAPDATVVVRDDGRGLKQGRDDSHGVRIMRERAQRVGAVLHLHNREDGPGTELRVVLATGSRSEGPGLILEGTAS